MHMYCLVRGIKHDVDRMINELQGKYLPFYGTDEQGNKHPLMLQFSVRPIQLYEFGFPKEALPIIMNSFWPNDPKYGVYPTNGTIFDATLWGLKKALNVDPLPETFDKKDAMPFYRDNVNVIGIGTREDKDTTLVVNGKKITVEGL